MIRSTKHALSLRSVYRRIEPFGSPVHWYEAGDVANPTILLMHGFMAHSMAFRRVTAELSRSYHLIVPDLPAHGRDQSYEDNHVAPTVESLMEWFQAVVRFIDGPMTVVGHSLGATLAYQAAKAIPSITRLCMVSPGLKIPSLPFAKTAVSLVPASLSKWVFTHTNTRFFEPLQWRGERMNQFELEALTRPLREASRMEFMLQLGADLLTHGDRTGSVQPIKAETLLVWGELDRTIPVETGLLLQDRMPDTELIIVEGAGHSPMEDRPDRFLQILGEFLAS